MTRQYDEMIELFSRMQTHITAERIRHSERFVMNQESIYDMKLRIAANQREIDRLGQTYHEVSDRVNRNYNHVQRLTCNHGATSQQMLDISRNLGLLANNRIPQFVGDNWLLLNVKLPNFADKTGEKPLVFINQISRYINTMDSRDKSLGGILDQASHGSAHDWWECIRAEAEYLLIFVAVF